MIDWDYIYCSGAPWIGKPPSKNALALAERLSPGAVVLDAGCGDGRNIPAFRLCGHKVFAIDVSAGAIEAAKATYGGPGVDIRIGDLYDLPYDTATFDAAYVGYVIQHLDMPVAARELARVLRPGAIGMFVVLLVTRHQIPCPYDVELEQADVDRALEPFFENETASIDEYWEHDDYGHHFHRRYTLSARHRA